MFEYKTTPVDEPLSLRDRIAIAAMPSILAGQIVLCQKQLGQMVGDDYLKIAQRAYRMADAMLKVRESRREPS